MRSPLGSKIFPNGDDQARDTTFKDRPVSDFLQNDEPAHSFQEWLSFAVADYGFSVLLIGDVAPDFQAMTTTGEISFHDWIGDSWCMMFSHPKSFTPVCTTELGALAQIAPEFEKRNCKIIGLSVDRVEDHREWARDIADVMGQAPNYPLIGDPELKIAKLYGMLPATGESLAIRRTAQNNKTVRTIHIINPDKTIAAMLTYPMTSGRNFLEVLRLLDSIQLSKRHKVATPVQWLPGNDVIIDASISDDEASRIFPDGWKAPKPYIRVVRQPSD